MKKKQPDHSTPEILNELRLHETIIEQTLMKKNPTTEDKLMGGTHLNWIQQNIKGIPELKEQYGKFEIYAKKKYNLGKSCAFNYTAVARRFSTHYENGPLTGIIKPEFAEFDHAQLIEMARDRVTDDMLKQVTPEMSVREIEELYTDRQVSRPISCTKEHRELHELIGSMTDDQYEIMLDFAKRLMKV